MAARKTDAVGKGTMPERWRARIKTSMLLNRLQSHVEGKADLSAAQVNSAKILLGKSLPDLSSITVAGDPDKPLEIRLSFKSGV